MKTVQEIEASYAARIREAYERALTTRDEAFVDAPFSVCGIPLRAMSLTAYLHLIAAGNAYVTSALAPEDDAEALRFWAAHNAQFLWVLCEYYKAGDTKARDAFVRDSVAFAPFEAITTGIRDYLQETFFDAPRKITDPSAAPTHDPLRVSFAAVQIHRLASTYGWSLAEILAAPLKQTFQLLRLIRFEEQVKSGKTGLGTTDESDHLWAEMLQEINELNAQPTSPDSQP
jgi:hypothetical protein